MFAELSGDSRPVPNWLMNASADDDLPVEKLLRDSLFYPACGLTGKMFMSFSATAAGARSARAGSARPRCTTPKLTPSRRGGRCLPKVSSPRLRGGI